METIFVFLFAFTSVVSSIAYIVELHIRIKRENELEELSKMNTSQFMTWKKGKSNGRSGNEKNISSK